MNLGTRCFTGLAAAALLAAGSAASANTFNLNWLNMGPTPFGSSMPNNSVFTLAGLGNVTVTYNFAPGVFIDARTQNPLLQNGNVVYSGDTYQWGWQELYGATNVTTANPVSASPWDITFTFSQTAAAGKLFLGVSGLGQTSSNGGGASIATVNQNGTFLGDWVSGGNYGPTQFTGGAGTFSMQNSLTGAGGADPWWNTELGVVRIDDSVNSLTVHLSQINGDGVGVNIAYIPAPGVAATLGAAGLVAVRRRRIL